MSDMRIANLTKGYREKGRDIPVLEDISVCFEAGKMHSVVGPSGCGKSTLLMVCGGLLRPDSGTVALGENNLLCGTAGERSREQAGLVGFVFQQFHLIPYLNIEQNIKASCLARLVDDADQRCEELIEKLGLSHRRGHIPAKLSSGEQQRVALGRALMNRPQVLIADEPTGNLDSDNAEHLMVLLREFADAGGLVLMATHDKSIASLADHCYEFTNRTLAPAG